MIVSPRSLLPSQSCGDRRTAIARSQRRHPFPELLRSAACRMKRDVSGLSEGASTQLLGYHWPGNVRELENAMERAAVLSGSTVELEDFARRDPSRILSNGHCRKECTLPGTGGTRIHSGDPCVERGQPDPHRKAASDRLRNVVSETKELTA